MVFDRFRTLPSAPAPNDDVSKIQSNLSLGDKQLLVNILAYHCANDVFGHKEASGLKLIELWVREVGIEGLGAPVRFEESSGQYAREGKAGHRLEGYTVCEITVQRGKS